MGKSRWKRALEKKQKFLSHVQAFQGVQVRTQAEAPVHHRAVGVSGKYRKFSPDKNPDSISWADLRVPRCKYRYKSLSVKGQLETNTNKDLNEGKYPSYSEHKGSLILHLEEKNPNPILHGHSPTDFLMLLKEIAPQAVLRQRKCESVFRCEAKGGSKIPSY